MECSFVFDHLSISTSVLQIAEQFSLTKEKKGILIATMTLYAHNSLSNYVKELEALASEPVLIVVG